MLNALHTNYLSSPPHPVKSSDEKTDQEDFMTTHGTLTWEPDPGSFHPSNDSLAGPLSYPFSR